MAVLEATLNIIAVVLLARLTIVTQMGLLGKGIRRGDYGQINNVSKTKNNATIPVQQYRANNMCTRKTSLLSPPAGQ